jgi:hypothetical protein
MYCVVFLLRRRALLRICLQLLLAEPETSPSYVNDENSTLNWSDDAFVTLNWLDDAFVADSMLLGHDNVDYLLSLAYGASGVM